MRLAVLFPLLAGFFLGPMLPSSAQTNRSAGIYRIREGELRLDGKITAVTGAGEWAVAASSWTSPRGVTKEFDEPKSKAIRLGENGAVLNASGEDISTATLKLGMTIYAVGSNQPDGSLLARFVAMKTENSLVSKATDTVRISRPVHELLSKGEAARKAGQVNLAVSKFKEAAETAGGLRDSSGEGLAWVGLGRLYSEGEQPQKALEAYNRALQAAQAANDRTRQASAYNEIGLVYENLRQREDAVKAFEEAVRLTSATNSVDLSIFMSNLLDEYMLINDRAKALPLAEKLLPLMERQGTPEELMVLQITTLDLLPMDDKVRQGALVTKIRANIARVKTPTARAKMLSELAWHQISLKNVPEAIKDYSKAADEMDAAGNKAAADSVRRQIKKLQEAQNLPHPAAPVA